MKRRFLAVLLGCVLGVTLCACGASKDASGGDSQKETSEEKKEEVKEESLLSVVGVLYGDVFKDQGTYYNDYQLDGMCDCIVVFDYTNDDTNRTLPESKVEPYSETDTVSLYDYTCSEVVLKVNETNSYEAFDINACDHYGNAIKRYTSYKYPVGYGNLLGGAEPVRMFAVFYANPNEMKPDSKGSLTVGDQTVEFGFDGIKKIKYADEVLSVENNYEELQQIAAFKWRMDETYAQAEFAGESVGRMGPSTELSGLGTAIGQIFSPEYGATISEFVQAGFDSTSHLPEGLVSDLPHFDVNVLTNTFPEQANDIKGLIDSTNKLGAAIQDSGQSKDNIETMLRELGTYYSNLTKAFDMETFKL